MRLAVLPQPVADQVGQGMATIQAAETLELRRTLARRGAGRHAGRQATSLAVIAAVVRGLVRGLVWRPVWRPVWVVAQRDADDRSPVEAQQAPRAPMPLIADANLQFELATVPALDAKARLPLSPQAAP